MVLTIAVVYVGVPLGPPVQVDDEPNGARHQWHLLFALEPASDHLAFLSPRLRPQPEDDVTELEDETREGFRKLAGHCPDLKNKSFHVHLENHEIKESTTTVKALVQGLMH